MASRYNRPGALYISGLFLSAVRAGPQNGENIWFSISPGAWCNTRLKTRPLKKFVKTLGEHTEIVGIAADEEKRIARKTVTGKVLPLVEHGITERGAAELCERRGLLSPAYSKGRSRLGCWFCHNQRIGELKRLYYDYPALWENSPVLTEIAL